MLTGAAVLPSAPLFVPGVARGVPASIEQLQASVRRIASGLADAEVAVLVTAGEPALHDAVTADLTGLGYPGIRTTTPSCAPAAAALSKLTQYPRVRRPRLPLDLACLTMIVGHGGPLVALEVAADTEYPMLSALGTGVVQALDDSGLTGVLIAAGDLSAGLTEQSPLALRDGAAAWDDRVVELCTDGAFAALADLGPDRAAAVGARGWAPLCVLAGAVAAASLSLTVRRYAAPRGVGYLIASTS